MLVQVKPFRWAVFVYKTKDAISRNSRYGTPCRRHRASTLADAEPTTKRFLVLLLVTKELFSATFVSKVARLVLRKKNKLVTASIVNFYFTLTQSSPKIFTSSPVNSVVSTRNGIRIALDLSSPSTITTSLWPGCLLHVFLNCSSA